GAREAERREQVEARLGQPLRRNAELLGAERFAEGPFVEREFDVEGRAERRLDRAERAVVEAFRRERLVVDRRRTPQRAMAQRIALDLGDLFLDITKRLQRLRHEAVNDLEIAAAGELLEFDERKIGLDAGRVAIHDETDRAGRRDDGRLRVAEAVLL